MTDSNLVVACAADNKYTVLATTMLKSIELNHCPDGGSVDVYLINNGISKSRLAKLHTSLDPEKIRLHILRPERQHLQKLAGIKDVHKLTAYFRLLLPYLLPRTVTKVLYLDCDILVLKPLTDLWETKLDESHIVAAVQDSNAGTVGCSWGGGIPNWSDFGMDAEAAYFNSGVLLIDMDKWRAGRISEKVVDITLQNQRHVIWLDQYGLNVVLQTRWKRVDESWNSFPHADVTDRCIVHFVSRNPNSPEYNGPFQDIFYQLLDETSWEGARPRTLWFDSWIPEYFRYRMRIMVQQW